MPRQYEKPAIILSVPPAALWELCYDVAKELQQLTSWEISG